MEGNSDDSVDECLNDKFNKYFKLYISHHLSRRIATNLNIQSSKFDSTFTMTFKSHISQKDLKSYFSVFSEYYKNSKISLIENIKQSTENLGIYYYYTSYS